MDQHRLGFIIFTVLSIISTWLIGQESAAELRIKHDICLLAHDSMQGRGSATADELRAARYIESEFRKAGLKPFPGYSDQYIRPFDFGHYIFGESKLKLGSVEYKPSVDFGAIAASADGSLENGVLLSADSLLSDTYNPTGDAKWVALLDMELNGKKKYPLFVYEDRIRQLERAGARAVILFHAPSESIRNRLFHPDSIAAFGIPVIYVSKAVAEQIFEHPGSACDIEVKINRKRRQSCNVIGFLDRRAEQTVVIGAHYDHVGITHPRGTGGTGREIHNGADDNASGTAVVMELARWLSQQEDLKLNYLFVAFGSEEMGLHGSYNFCNTFPELGNISWMLNFDMVGRLGWNGKNRLSVLGIASSPSWKDILPKPVNSAFCLRKIKGAPGFSDHYPFIKKEIPVIYFTTGLHKDYHTPLDDPERINYTGIAGIVEYIEPLILQIEASGSPRFSRVSVWNDIGATFRLMVFR